MAMGSLRERRKRRSGAVPALIALAAVATLVSPSPAPAAGRAPSAPVTYTRHLTRMADGTNAPCGALKMLVVRAHLQPGHRFHQLHAFRLRLRSGATLRIGFEPWNLSDHGRVATWYAHDVGAARVSRHLVLSRTTFTATPGSTWHASISKSCYTL